MSILHLKVNPMLPSRGSLHFEIPPFISPRTIHDDAKEISPPKAINQDKKTCLSQPSLSLPSCYKPSALPPSCACLTTRVYNKNNSGQPCQMRLSRLSSTLSSDQLNTTLDIAIWEPRLLSYTSADPILPISGLTPPSPITLESPLPPMLNMPAPLMLYVPAPPILDVPALLLALCFIAPGPSNPHDPGPSAAFAEYAQPAFSIPDSPRPAPPYCIYQFLNDFLLITPRSPNVYIVFSL